MTIYGIISRVSGSGKTYFRQHCDALGDTRTVDIADIYELSVSAGDTNLNWHALP